MHVLLAVAILLVSYYSKKSTFSEVVFIVGRLGLIRLLVETECVSE